MRKFVRRWPRWWGGHTPLPTFESLIAEMMAAKALTSAEARAELEEAVKDGTLKPESLRRLGLLNPGRA